MKSVLAFVCAFAVFSCAVMKIDTLERRSTETRGLNTSGPSFVDAAAPSTVNAENSSPQDGLLVSRSALWARWNSLRGDSYELDDRDRFLDDPKTRLRCDSTGLVNYAGTTVRYHGPVRINEHFQPRLERFEQVVADVATRVYGRAPRRIKHYGAYVCRTSRNRSARLSEHALGNAIDVIGFDFGPAAKTDVLDPSLPRALKHPFQVRVARHWDRSGNPVSETHARFLRELIDALLDRDDIFRGFVGPGHRNHEDHFHFDMSPWRFVRL